MHECWSSPYSTFRKAFLERLCHLCCKGGTPSESCLHYDVVLATMQWCYKPGFSWGVIQNLVCSWMSQCSMGWLALVGLGQSQGSGNGGHKEGGAGHDHRASRPEHLPAVQGLDRPEGPHHRLSIVELELREHTELREQEINTDVKLRPLQCV